MSIPRSDVVPALVLGSGLTSLGVIRIFRRAGIPAVTYGHPPGLERRSRWYREAPLSRPVQTTDLAELLDAVALERAVLIPCSDAWARQAAATPAALRERFPASIAATAVIETLEDKAGLSRALEAAGVPHPTTRVLAGPDDLASLPDDVFTGAFLKPHHSQSFFARFGVKAFRAASREDAVRRMREAREAGLEVLLQEYIPGPGSLHYFVDGFVDAAGTVQAVFARRRLRMYPRDFGNSSFMASVPPEEAAQAIDAIRTLLGHLGFRGIFSAEFKRDPRDGRFKLIEVNVRAWWYVEFAARCGVDVCTMAWRDAQGLPVAPVVRYRVGERLVYPYYDYFACRDAHRESTLSLGAWLRSWLGAQEPLFNWSDPAPALIEAWQTAGTRALRSLRRHGGTP